MEWTKGIAAILFVCLAGLISTAHCITTNENLQVRNVQFSSVSTWGFTVSWDAPLSSSRVDAYVVELFDGTDTIETQNIPITDPRLYVFEGLPPNTEVIVVLWSIENYGPDDELQVISLPVLSTVTTLVAEVSLNTPATENSLSISVPATTANFNNYYVSFTDVETQNVYPNIRSNTNVGLTLTQGDLDTISGAAQPQRGRLIQVTVRENDASGQLIGNPVRFRTLLDPPIQTLSDPTGNTVDVLTNYISEADSLEVVATPCTNAQTCNGPPVVTEIRSGFTTTVEGLDDGGLYRFEILATVGERDRTAYRPTYIFSRSAPIVQRLVKLQSGQPPNPTELNIVWNPIERSGVTSLRLKAISPTSVTTYANNGNTLSPTTTTATIPGLLPGTLYTVELEYSTNTVTSEQLSLEQIYTPLLPVSGALIPEDATQTSITVSWNAVTMDIEFLYELTISPDPDTNWIPIDGRFTTDGTEFTFYGLLPGVLYSIGVQTRADDPMTGELLTRSEFLQMSTTTASSILSVTAFNDDARRVSVSWFYPGIGADSEFEVTLQTNTDDDNVLDDEGNVLNDGEANLDDEIMPSTVQVLPRAFDAAQFQGLQPGIVYKVTLREVTDGGDKILIAEMEFKFLIKISASLDGINAKKSVISFKPTDSLAYDGYLIEAFSGTQDTTCQDYVSEFGQERFMERGCARYWTNKPGSCQIQYDVTATRFDRRISDTVSLTANDDNSASYTIYEGGATNTSIHVWWLVDNNPTFDYYYLEVKDENSALVYCTAIPRPTETWKAITIEGLEPGTCYTVTLQQWLYDEVEADRTLSGFDAELKMFTALGSEGSVSKLYVLTQTGNNLELGWGTPQDEQIPFSAYQVCLEPVENPAAYQPLSITDDSQMRTLENVVDRSKNRRYRVAVTTYIDDTGKQRQYADANSDLIDLDAPFRGALTVIDIGTTYLQAEWQRDEEYLPTTEFYRVSIFDEDEQLITTFTTNRITTSPITYTETALIPGTLYCIEVEWLNTVPSVERTVCERTLPIIPGTITVLTSDIGLTSVPIRWDESSGNKDFYLIYATDLDNQGPRLRSGRTDNDVTSFVVEGLIPATNYRIEVEAVSGTEADNTPSPPREVIATTRAIDPCAIIITDLGQDWIEVRWGVCPEAKLLQICPNPDPTNPDGNPFLADVNIATANTGGTRLYTFNGLRESKKYSIFLRADANVLLDSTTSYTEPSQPTVGISSRTPTSVTVSVSVLADKEYPDDLHTIAYTLYDEDDELLRADVTNGQDAYGKYVWTDLEPDTAYICRVTITAGLQQELQTSSDRLEGGIPCPTTPLLSNRIYLESCDEDSMSLIWGNMDGASNRIDINPPPMGTTSPSYQLAISENSGGVVGNLERGQDYTVTLLRGTSTTPVHTLVVFTKPASTEFSVNFVDQTSISIAWQWPHDNQLIDYFAIDHYPEISARELPIFVPFWHREYTLECLLPGRTIDVSLTSSIKDGATDYFNSQPFIRQIVTAALPRNNLEMICVCVTSESFTVAWSDWIPPSGFDHHGYQIEVYPYSLQSGFQLKDTVKVAPEDQELFHNFYDILAYDEYQESLYPIGALSFFLVYVKILGVDSNSNTIVERSDRKLILTSPEPPLNLERVPLDAPESKISIKVAWDPATQTIADCKTTYKVYWNRFGYEKIGKATVNPDEGDPLEYTIIGLDPQDPAAAPDLGDPEQRPAAYKVWVVCICEATFEPFGEQRKKRQADLDVPEEDFVVESEPGILDYAQMLTAAIEPSEILAQVVTTRNISTLFGANPDIAKEDGKYRFFIDTVEDLDPFNSFEARGGTLDVDGAPYFFKYLFDDLWPGTVFTITLSVELEQPVDGVTDVRNSIQVLTCPEPPKNLAQSGDRDAVSLEFLWDKPDGHYTSFEVIFETDGLDAQVQTVEDLSVAFDKLYPDTEYIITIRSVRYWEERDVTKKSEPVSLTVKTEDLRELQIAIQDFDTDSINIVFGETREDVVYEVSIDPGNCPCGWVEFGQHCYYIAHTSRVTYDDAQAQCQQYDGHLTSILNQEEQEFLNDCTENDPSVTGFGFWIGLNDQGSEGTYQWEDGSTFIPADAFWVPAQPNDINGNEDCVTSQTTDSLDTWADISCNTLQPFICKKLKARPTVDYPVQLSSDAEYAFTTLIPGKCYTITVDADGIEPRTDRQRTRPEVADAVAVIDITPSLALLTWVAPPGVHDGYYISYVPSDSGENPIDYPYRLLKGDTDAELDDLLPDTAYTVKLWTVAGSEDDDCGEYRSEPVERTFRTSQLFDGTAYIQDVSTDSITIVWNPPTTDLAGFQLSLCPDDCDDPVFRGADKTKHQFEDLVPGREYAILFQVVRINGNTDPEQLLLQRTLPVSVQDDSFEAEIVDLETVRFSWDEPGGGDFDQYALTYSISHHYCPKPIEFETKYFNKDIQEYELWVKPDSVVLASLVTRSQLSCTSSPTDSAPVMEKLYSAKLRPLEIFIKERDSTSLLVSWGRIEDIGVPSILYELTWFGEIDQSDSLTRETKNNAWLIQGLLPGKEYYIKVEYQNLESPNRGYFSTAIYPPGTLSATEITPNTAKITWPRDTTALVENYYVKYGSDCSGYMEPFILDVDDFEDNEDPYLLLDDLQPNTDYNIEVIATQDDSNIHVKSSASFTSFKTQSIPFDECLIIDVDPTSITAIWDAVSPPVPAQTNDERFDIFMYQRKIRVFDTGEIHGEEEFLPSEHPYVEFENLWPGRQYELCCILWQINTDRSASSENCQTQITAPEEPSTLTIYDEEHRGFCATWTGPVSNFDNYVIMVLDEDGNVVYPLPGDANLPANAPVYESLPPDTTWSCIDGLFPGVTYTFVVGTWVDGDPAPQFSEMLSEEAMTLVLEPREILLEEQQKDSLTIEWGPIDDPDIENPEYVIKWYKEGEPETEMTPSTNMLRWTLPGLTAGTGYFITVCNGDDCSPNSDVFYTVPCPPEMPVIAAPTDNSGTRFTIAWSPPSDGGFEAFRISYLRVNQDPEELTVVDTVDKDVRIYTLEGLYVGTMYSFFVETLVGVEEEDEVLVGEATSDRFIMLGQTLSLPPLELELSSRDCDSILIGWGPLLNPTDQEVIYTIRAETETGAVASIGTVPVGDVTVIDLGPLNSGIKYNIQVTIGNQESLVLCVYTLPKPPGDIFRIQATAETLDIGWGAAINFVGQYEITYIPVSNDAQPVLTSPQDREVNLEGLQRNTEYTFTIVNTVGEGIFKTDSEPKEETFRTRNAKLNIVGDPTTTEITAQWTPEAGEVDSYVLRVIDIEIEDVRVLEIPENIMSKVIPNLIPGTPYRLELFSVFDGEEILSDIETAKTLPAAPENLVLTGNTFSSLNVEWDEPSSGKFDVFEVTYDYVEANPGESVGRTASPSTTLETDIALEGLLPEMVFTVQVKSVRRFGDEVVSSEAIADQFATLQAPAGSLIVRSVTEETIGVRWTSIPGAVDGYSLQVINVNTNDVITYPDAFMDNENDIIGLVPGAVYEIQLTAVRINGGDNQFQATIPRMVSSLSRIQRSIDNITLGWDGFSGGIAGEATGFIVTVYPLPDDAPPFWEIPNRRSPGEEVTLSLDNLINDQQYDFTIVTYTEFTGSDGVERREISEMFKYSVSTYDLNPGQVQVLDVELETVCFKWGSTESGAATAYELRIQAVDDASDYQVETININTAVLEHCFDDVEPGTLYDVTVNVTGSQESGSERVRTLASRPNNLREEMTYQCSITIAWDPADGQADAYRVYYRQQGTDDELQLLDIVYASQPLEYTLEDLTADTEYEFRVKTVTSGELEEISNAAVIVVATDIELLTIVQAGNDLTITWDPVVSSFLIYEVYYTPDDGDQPNSIFLPPNAPLSVPLTGLTTGQQYTVLLNTLTGTGGRVIVGRTCFTLVPPPIPDGSITVRSVPGQAHTAIVTFDIPTTDATLIGNLVVRATPGSTGAGAGDPVELEFIVPFEACPEIRLYGLCPETYYVISVYTQSGSTLSEAQTTSITTPSATPGQISFGEFTSTSIEIFWFYTGAPIASFTLRIAYESAAGITQVLEQKDIAPGEPRTYIFENLTPGVLYTVTVSIRGSSSYLDRKSIRTRPIILLGNFDASQVDHDSVTLSWPTATGVDGYEVCYFDVDDRESRPYDVDVQFTESAVENLTPDSFYVFSVASYIGDGEERSISDKLTLTVRTAPDPTVASPTNLFVHSVGPHEVTLQWDVPVRDNYDYFLVEYSPDDVGNPASPVLLPGDQLSLEISDLVSDTNYLFAVYAVEGRVGLGELRSVPATVLETTDSFPFTIEPLDVTDTRIEITWGQPQTTSLFEYEVTFDPSDGFVTKPIIANNELRVAALHNLQPDQYYDITVWARDFNGNVLLYAQRTIKTLDLPVRSLRARAETPSSVFLSWPPATEQSFGGAQTIDDTVTEYHIVLRGYSDFRGPGAFIDYDSVGQSACPSITLRELDPGQKYYVSVIAVDVNGDAVTAPASIVIQTLPPEVLDLHVIDVSSSSIEVAWSEAAGDFSNYLLQYNPPGSTSIATIFSKDDEREFEIEGLQAGVLYSIQLTVQSITNPNLYSTTITQYTVPVSPSGLVFSRIRDTGFNAAWPTVNALSDFYSICVYPDPQDISVADVYGTSYELEDLASNTNHLVSVFNNVQDQNGETVWSVPFSGYQQTTVGEPGVPIVIDYDENSVDVNWVRVEGINRYYVRRTKLDGTDLFTDNVQATEGLTVDYTFENLQPGYEYILSVRPDSGQYQEASTRQRTRPLPPLFPRSEINLDNPTERTISWQPPSFGKVDRYELTYSPANGSPPPPIYVNTGEPLRRTIRGLDPGQTYVFIVTSEAGVNDQNILTRSEPAVADIDLVIQLAVENFNSYFINVAWPSLPGDFDTYVISYDPYDEFKPNVRPSPVEIGRQYDVTSLNIYGLEPGQEYTISLQTKTGRSYSPVIQQVTQTTVPLNVDAIRVALLTASSFTFSWDNAEGVNDRYQVIFEPVADVNNPAPALGNLPRETLYDATGGRRTIEVSDLEPAQEYRITVVTWSNDQFSSGTTVIATTRPFPPSFVEVLDTTSNSVEVQWYVSEAGNRGVTKYQVEVVPRGNTRPVIIDASSGRNTQVIPGLVPGQAYQARIQSIVVDINGEYLESLPVSAAFVTVPLSPIFTSNPDVTATAVTLRWESGGGQLSRYQVEYSPIPSNPSILSPINVTPSPNQELTINGLDPSTEYTFTIRAITSVTVSDSQSGTFDVIKESLRNTVFHTTLPFRIPNFYVTSTTPTSVGLAWSAPGGPSDSYRIQIISDDINARAIDVNPSGDLEFLVQGLQPNRVYMFSIVNIVNGRASVESYATASTGEGIPGPPAEIDAEQTSPNSIRVEWSPPEESNGNLVGYILVISKRSTDGRTQIESEEIVIEDPRVLYYEFEDLPTGYHYTFTIAALNSAGAGEPFQLGEFIPIRETSPPETDEVPYQTQRSKDPNTISIAWRRNFFDYIYGHVANYSILVVEDRPELGAPNLVGNPPRSYAMIRDFSRWPPYQASPPGYNPFVGGIVKRQAPGGGFPDQFLEEAEFVIGEDGDCPDNPFVYCNGRLRPSTYYRVAIRAYGQDGTFTDTPWSDPISTDYDPWYIIWFVIYGVAGLIGLIIILLILCCCVRLCCGRRYPGDRGMFEDSEDSQTIMMKKSMNNGTPPMEYKRPHYRPPPQRDYVNRPPPTKGPRSPPPSYRKQHGPPSRLEYEQGYRPPMYREPSNKARQSKQEQPRRVSQQPRRESNPPRRESNAPRRHSQPRPSDAMPKDRIYGTPTSQFSKPIFIDQFNEHMRLMNVNGGIRFTEELNKLSDIGANIPTNAAQVSLDKNRYRNIMPYDSNRVCLQDPADGSDYVNASFVDGVHSKNEYIVSQGPLPNTIEDFWEMVWEHEIPTIVMNTNLVDSGRVKCEKYWPDSGEAQFGRFTIKLISESDTSDWTVRTFDLSKDGVFRGNVRLYHFRNWPDNGAPSNPRSVLKFLRMVRSTHPRKIGPGILVHCSAGVGRSGTFVALDMILQQLMGSDRDSLDIFGVVAKLRQQRRFMVQSEAQYKFVHHAVQLALQQQSNMDSMLDGSSNWGARSIATSQGFDEDL